MQAEEMPCIYDFDFSGAKISPSLHSCDILCSVWPIPAEHSVCARGNYALFASHHTTRVLREFHTPQCTTVYFKCSPVPPVSLMAWQQNEIQWDLAGCIHRTVL